MKLMKFTLRGSSADLFIHPTHFVGMIVGGGAPGINVNADGSKSLITTLLTDDGRAYTIDNTPEDIKAQLSSHTITYDPVTPIAPPPAPTA